MHNYNAYTYIVQYSSQRDTLLDIRHTKRLILSIPLDLSHFTGYVYVNHVCILHPHTCMHACRHICTHKHTKLVVNLNQICTYIIIVGYATRQHPDMLIRDSIVLKVLNYVIMFLVAGTFGLDVPLTGIKNCMYMYV